MDDRYEVPSRSVRNNISNPEPVKIFCENFNILFLVVSVFSLIKIEYVKVLLKGIKIVFVMIYFVYLCIVKLLNT